VSRAIARILLIAAVVVAGAACGYDTTATFNSDGTVNVALKFLFPKSLMGGSSTSVTGLSPADIDKANTELKSKYPGAKITRVTEGDETGALMALPFKTEKDAFAFLTEPSKLKPAANSGSKPNINLANTGGLFASAIHTTSGQSDVYTFKTQPATQPSPSPGTQELLTADQLASVFTITFVLTVPHEITSAPGALFTHDRKTAIWKLSWTKAETLTATTGPGLALTGFVSNAGSGPSPAILIALALAAIAVGFVLGQVVPRRLLRAPVVAPAEAHADASLGAAEPLPPDESRPIG
jgi:hypothetical protein